VSSNHEVPETDVRDSNPNAAGPHGLEGDMGISSERTGPLGSSPADHGIEGTGSHGTAPHRTDGVLDTERDTQRDTPDDTPREHPQDPAEGPDDDDAPDQERTSPEDPAEGAGDTGVDRTVGEVQPDPVRNKHEFDPARNPGH
jgi:hypothetical protein